MMVASRPSAAPMTAATAAASVQHETAIVEEAVHPGAAAVVVAARLEVVRAAVSMTVAAAAVLLAAAIAVLLEAAPELPVVRKPALLQPSAREAEAA